MLAVNFSFHLKKSSGICFQQSATPNIYFPNTFKPQLNQLRIKNPDLRVCRCRLRRCRCAGTAWRRSATRTRWARGRPSAGPSTRPSATPGTQHPALFITFNYCCKERRSSSLVTFYILLICEPSREQENAAEAFIARIFCNNNDCQKT